MKLVGTNGNEIEGYINVKTFLGTIEVPVFTVSVDASGNVTFTEDRAVKEVQTNPADAADNTVSFGKNLITLTQTITDGDDSTASKGIDLGPQLSITDDGPKITLTGFEPTITLSESHLPNGTHPNSHDTSETLNFGTGFLGLGAVFSDNFGADGAAKSGAVSYALSIGNGSDSGLKDTQTGDSIVLTQNGNTITGADSVTGNTVFTITLDPSAGDVKFTLDAAIKDNGSGPAGVSLAGLITLTQTITDGDGSKVYQGIDIGSHLSIIDDTPVTNKISLTVADDGNSGTQNLFGASGAGDSAGADGLKEITVAFGNNPVLQVNSGDPTGAKIEGQYGTLTVNFDGTYSYQANPNVVIGSTDTFSYKLTDLDGSTSTSKIVVTVGAGAAAQAGGDSGVSVAESGLSNGSAPVTGGHPSDATGQGAASALTFTAGGDDLHVAFAASTVTALNSSNTVRGLTWSLVNSDEIDAKQGGQTVAELILSGGANATQRSDGSFLIAAGATGTVVVTETLENPILNEGSLTGNLGTLAVTATDTINPTSVTDNVTVTVIDDKPATNNISLTVADDGNSGTQNLFGASGAGDSAGADGLKEITVAFGNNPVLQVNSGDPTGAKIEGQYGTLTVNFDGTYSYQANPNVVIGSTDTFSYKLTDLDGSTSTSKIVVTVGAGAAAQAGGDSGVSVAESGLSNGSAPVTGGHPSDATGQGAASALTFTAGGDDLHVAFAASTVTALNSSNTVRGLTWSLVNSDEIDAKQGGQTVAELILSGGANATQRSDGSFLIAAGATGTVVVTETLENPILNEGSLTGNLGTLAVTATDTINPTSVTDNVTVTVIDDKPATNNISLTVADDGNSGTQNLFGASGAGDSAGADG